MISLRCRLLALLLAAIFLCACAPTAAAPQPTAAPTQTSTKEPTYRFGIGYTGSGYTSALTSWAKAVFDRTNGDVEILLYGNNMLGTDIEMVEATKNGTLTLAACTPSVYTDLVPQAAIMDIPFCYTEYICPNILYAHNGDYFRRLNESYRKAGFELMYLAAGDYRALSSKTPITKLSDIRSMKIRSLANPYHTRLWELLGAEPIDTVRSPDLQYALKNGVIDGAETAARILNSEGLLDLQPYALNGPFVVSSSIVMNRDAFLSLPTDYQTIMKEELGAHLHFKSSGGTPDIEGLTITELSDADMAKLREIAQPLLDEILSTVDTALLEALIKEHEHID